MLVRPEKTIITSLPKCSCCFCMPRGAVVWHMNAANTLKALYGSAFRMPTVFELGFADPSSGFLQSQNLQPEKIRQIELVWEGRLTRDLLISAAAYKLSMTRLIAQETDTVTGITQFVNDREVTSRGLELQADYRRSDGLWSYISYSRQRANEGRTRMVNSAANLAKAGISTPTSRPLQGAIELRYETGRLTFAGNETQAALLTNLTLSAALRPSMRLSITVKNLTNVQYATPGGLNHLEDTIPQDGRTLLVRLRVGG